MELGDRVVVITGATGGLGRAVAEALHARGARLALLDLDADAVRAQATALGGADQARGWVADVRDLAQLERTMGDVAAHFGQIDVVIAGAGITTVAPIESIDPEAFERVIDINLNGVWRTFRAALPHVREQHGYLLAISSMAAFVHSPLQAQYAASKAGVWAMCDAIRLELRHLGVGVGSLHPTFFKTPMMEDVVADPAGREVWGGNDRGIWAMVPIEQVVSATVRMIERREQTVAVPRRITPIAKAPWLFRPSIERLGWRGSTIERAVKAAAPSGWHDDRARHRTGG
jgi:NAD(P)-dependent dehydrogenase (short-subunit alcohol dehydrogenase family)